MIDQRVLKLTPEFIDLHHRQDGPLGADPDRRAGAGARMSGSTPSAPARPCRARGSRADHFARQRAATVLGRGANPADITAALGFFLDAPAVTGQILRVDGGQHLAWQTPDVLGVE